jgi:hypothetical protein
MWSFDPVTLPLGTPMARSGMLSPFMSPASGPDLSELIAHQL